MDQVDDEHPELGRKENSLKWPHMERVTHITKPYFNGRPPKIKRRKRISISISRKREEKENVFFTSWKLRGEWDMKIQPRVISRNRDRSEILLVHPVWFKFLYNRSWTLSMCVRVASVLLSTHFPWQQDVDKMLTAWQESWQDVGCCFAQLSNLSLADLLELGKSAEGGRRELVGAR